MEAAKGIYCAVVTPLDQRENMTVNIIGLVKWYLNHGIQHILEDKMLIDISNAEVINSKQINIHDDILNELTFDRNEKKLTLFFESLTEPRNFYYIIFYLQVFSLILHHFHHMFHLLKQHIHQVELI